MALRRSDICGATEVKGNTIFVCTLPREHIKLQVVRPNDSPEKFVKPLSGHNFIVNKRN